MGAQGPRYLFSRATKERGRAQLEGLGPQFRKMLCLFGLYRSGDCTRSLPRRQFHTTALFSGQNRPRLGRESWIPSVVPKMRSRPFSRFAKINYPIIFPRHNFFFKIRKKRGKFKQCGRFITFLRRKGLICYKIVYVPSVQKAPGPRTLFSLAPLSLGRTKYLGLWAHLPTRHIYN